MITFATSALLLTLLCLPSAETPAPAAPGQILAVVPEGCQQLAYCQDFAGLRSRAERNDFFRLLLSEDGSQLRDELELSYRNELQLDLEDLYPLASALRGESVFFLLPGVACFFTEAPEPREEVRAALRSWFPDPGPLGARRTLEIATATVEIVSWPVEGKGAWGGRKGHYAALVEHPSGLGLLSADDLELLTAALGSTLTRLGSDARSPLVQAFESARKSAARSGGIEFYVDFSSYASSAERLLRESVEDALPDPAGMLGLEQGTWLHGSLDVHPGRRIDCRGFLNVPRETLAAKLADTFGPLPVSLPGRLPKGLSGLWALQWDIKSFYRSARQAFLERHGEESLGTVDAGVEAVKGMTGVDPIVELVGNLDGTFAFYSADPEQEIAGDEGQIMAFGLLFGLSNGAAFLDACERLIDATMESVLELSEVEGADVYTIAESHMRGMEDAEGNSVAPGGVAFLPQNFVLCASGDVLARQLRALQQVAGASLALEETWSGCFAEKRGSTFYSCVDLAWLLETADLRGLRGPASQSGEEPAAPRAALLEALLVSTARRTPRGFELELEIR